MTISKEQASQELRRRQAIAELKRRGLIDPNATMDQITPQKPAGGLVAPEAGISTLTAPSIISSEPYINQDEQERWLQEKIASGDIEPISPSFWKRFRSEIPQMAGGTVGGLAGAKAGAMAGAKIPAGHPYLKGAAVLGGAALGAGLGGMGGTGYQQFYRITHGSKPMTLRDIYTEQAIAGIEEAASELIGRGIAKGGAKLLAPFKKRLLPGARGLNKVLIKRGAHLTPAQMTESRIMDTIEGMSEKSFLGGGKLQRLKTLKQPAAFSRYIDDVIEQINRGAKNNLSSEEIGDLLLDTIQGKELAFRTTAKTAYAKVDRLTGRTQVSTASLKDFARKVMQRSAARKGIGGTQAGDTLLKKVLQLDDVITFKQAQGLRSALLDEQWAMATTRDKAIGLTKQFIKLTNDSMEKSAKDLSPDALKAWRVANKFYKTGKQTFNSKIIKSLTKNLSENPEVAVRKIFQKDATKQIRLVKNLVDKKTWQTLKVAYLEETLRQSADVDKIIFGKSFLNRLEKVGKPTLKEIYNGQELQSIRSIGKLATMMQKPTGGSGGMLIQLTQAGAVLNLGRMAVGGAPALSGESGAILIGPPILSRMLANPKWSKWLSTGIKLPKGTPAASAMATRLSRVIMQIKREQAKEKKIETPSVRELRGFSGRGF